MRNIVEPDYRNDSRLVGRGYLCWIHRRSWRKRLCFNDNGRVSVIQHGRLWEWCIIVVELIQKSIRWDHRRYSWWRPWGYRTPSSPGILDLLLRKKARNARRRCQATFRPGDGCKAKYNGATTSQRASLSPEIRFIQSGRGNTPCRRDGVPHNYSKPAFCGGTIYLSEGRARSIALIFHRRPNHIWEYGPSRSRARSMRKDLKPYRIMF